MLGVLFGESGLVALDLVVQGFGHFPNRRLCGSGGDLGVDDTGQEGDDAHDWVVGLRERGAVVLQGSKLLRLLLEVVILNGKLEEADYTLLPSPSSDMVCNLIPVLIVELQSLEQQEGLLVSPWRVLLSSRVRRILHADEVRVAASSGEATLKEAVGAELNLLLRSRAAGRMIAHAGAVNTAGVAVVQLLSGLVLRVTGGAIGLSTTHTVSGGIIDVFADLQVKLSLRGASAGGALGCRVRLSGRSDSARGGLEGLQTTWGIRSYPEVTSKWGTNV